MEATPEEIHQTIDHLFRRQAGKVVAALTRQFGSDHLDLAEDIIHDILLKALDQWPRNGIPPEPGRWMLAAARNLAVDHLRRKSFMLQHESEITAHFEGVLQNEAFIPILDSEIADDMLRMIFTCCHPILTRESQIALTLRTLSNFTIEDIARALSVEESAAAKRIVRAKAKLREVLIPFEVPIGNELEPRVNGVLNVLYLIFSLGYQSQNNDRELRREICEDAIRWSELLSASPAGGLPKIDALIAFMYFQFARFDAQYRPDGEMLTISVQDRTLWNWQMIGEGFLRLERSARGELISEYHLEAAILACHCSAESFEETDWKEIVNLYDVLVTLNPAPGVAKGREFALKMASS